MKKYEAMRMLPQETFDVFKKLYYTSHTNIFEGMASVVKYAIAGLLAYISYDQYDVNTALSVLSGISSLLIIFRKRAIGFIPAIITAIKMTKKVISSKEDADEVANFLETTAEGMSKFATKQAEMV